MSQNLENKPIIDSTMPKIYTEEKRTDRSKLAYSASETISSSMDAPNNVHFDLFRACFAEFVGTAIFIFIGSMSTAEKLSGAYGAFGHGFAIVALAFSFGRISGGHFNPAVTIGCFVAGAIHWTKALLYIVVQLLGGFVGALFLRAVLSPCGSPVAYLSNTACNLSSTAMYIAGGVTIPQVTNVGQAITMEFCLTFILMTVILCTDVDTQTDKERNVLAPLAIGFTIFVNILTGREVSGGSMNPARSFGPAVAYSIFRPTSRKQWTYQYVYWAGPIVGALLASIIYKLTLGSRKNRWHRF